MKNKMAGLLMETGALYVKEKLHRKKYFARLLEELEEVPESVIDLLRLSRGALEMFENTQKRLVRELLADPELVYFQLQMPSKQLRPIDLIGPRSRSERSKKSSARVRERSSIQTL